MAKVSKEFLNKLKDPKFLEKVNAKKPGRGGNSAMTARQRADHEASHKRADKVWEGVDHPKHYNSNPSGVEAITVVEHMTFNVGNAVKYCWRAGFKDGAPAGQDLAKAIWYLERELQRLDRTVKK